MSRQKIPCIFQAFHISKKRPKEWKKVHALLKKKSKTKSVLAFLSKIIYICPIMTQEMCSYLFCVDFWAKILALSKLVELHSLACVGQMFQPFANSILSTSIFLWRLTRNTAQIELSKKRHSNFKSFHFKSISDFYWIFCSAHLYHFSLTAQAINYISEHSREGDIPVSFYQWGSRTTKYWAIVQGHWENKE